MRKFADGWQIRSCTLDETDVKTTLWKPGVALALARWGPMGAQFQLERPGATICSWIKDLLVYFAAALRILLVYLSENLGRLSQNGGPLGAHFSLGGAAPVAPVEPPLNLDNKISLTNWHVHKLHIVRLYLSYFYWGGDTVVGGISFVGRKVICYSHRTW